MHVAYCIGHFLKYKLLMKLQQAYFKNEQQLLINENALLHWRSQQHPEATVVFTLHQHRIRTTFFHWMDMRSVLCRFLGPRRSFRFVATTKKIKVMSHRMILWDSVVDTRCFTPTESTTATLFVLRLECGEGRRVLDCVL